MNANERQYVIRFDSDPPTWYDGSYGDPGRTTILARAQIYHGVMSARRAHEQLWARYRRIMQIVTLDSQREAAP